MHNGDIWRTFLALSWFAISTPVGFHSLLGSATNRVSTWTSLGGNLYTLLLEGYLFLSALCSLRGSHKSGVLARSHGEVLLSLYLEVEEKETLPDPVPAHRLINTLKSTLTIET